MKTTNDRPRPFTDAEFNEIRRNLTARGTEGEDTVHAGAVKMFERLFATVDTQATILSEVGGRVGAQLMDPGEFCTVAVLVRSPKTAALAIHQARIRREIVLDPAFDQWTTEVVQHLRDGLQQLIAKEGA